MRKIAFDKRTTDIDGRLHVTDNVLTAAQVNGYAGIEIPDSEKLGLDPNEVYQLYRTPEALRAALPLFENQPLLIDHIAVSAADPKTQYICGSVSNARWSNGKVYGDIAVWDQSAIDLIKSGERRDLSVGYRYDCDMTPGVTPDGVEFDGTMGNLKPNHVSLVVEGRVSGAYVADSALDIEIVMDRPRVRRARRAADCEIVVDAACLIKNYYRLGGPAR